MDLHLRLDRAAGSLAWQLAGQLREAARSDRLGAGTRLPSSRELAGDLGVSRGVGLSIRTRLASWTTVLDWLDSWQGRGIGPDWMATGRDIWHGTHTP